MINLLLDLLRIIISLKLVIFVEYYKCLNSFIDDLFSLKIKIDIDELAVEKAGEEEKVTHSIHDINFHK